MDFLDRMEAVKESEDEKFVIYKYGHFASREKLTGSFRITNDEKTEVSTVKLEKGYETRVNEMRIAGKLIVEHLITGVWPEKSSLV